jgi:hypothetical protein
MEESGSKISLWSRPIRKDGAEKSAMAGGIQELPETLEHSLTSSYRKGQRDRNDSLETLEHSLKRSRVS